MEVQASCMLAGDHRSLVRQREARRTAAIPQVQRSWVEIRYRRSFSSKKSSFSVICVILLLPCSHVREVNKNFSLTAIGDSKKYLSDGENLSYSSLARSAVSTSATAAGSSLETFSGGDVFLTGSP